MRNSNEPASGPAALLGQPSGRTPGSSYVFGPVPSRRLGRSLGVDLVPYKTCSYDCIYCQLGRTTCKTIERKEWIPLDKVIRDLQARLTTWADYITLSGSGEPTLYSRIDELIAAIQAMTEIPVAVPTNGSLLWQPEVRAQLRHADLAIPSLDAGDELRFRGINRPHPAISFEQMVEGLVKFRQEYTGRYWLEVFLLDGYTSIRAEVEKLARLAQRIQPDKVQLNTVDRPPAEEFALAVPPERMKEWAAFFHPSAEVVAKFRGLPVDARFTASRDILLNLLRRRPCTVNEVEAALSCHHHEVVKMLAHLETQGEVERCKIGGGLYYRAIQVSNPFASA